MPTAPAELEVRDAMRDWERDASTPGTCEGCRFFDARVYPGSGTCRRFPPIFHHFDYTRQPAVRGNDWCGEWREREP